MPTLEVGPHSVVAGEGIGPDNPEIVEGSGAPGSLLADHDDESYVDLTTLYANPFNSGWYRIDRVDGEIVVTVPDGATNVTYVKAMVRASATDPDSSPGGTRLNVHLHDADYVQDFELTDEAVLTAGTSIPTDGGVYEIDLPDVYTYGAGTILGLLTSGDAIVSLSVFTPGESETGTWTNTARVYEFFVYVSYDLDGATEETVRRIWPRSDGLGLSTAPRIWPPTPSPVSSNKVVGGYPDD